MADEEKETLDMGDGCTLRFDIQGNITIGKGCEGKIINPVEIQLLDRVNEDNEAT